MSFVVYQLSINCCIVHFKQRWHHAAERPGAKLLNIGASSTGQDGPFAGCDLDLAGLHLVNPWCFLQFHELKVSPVLLLDIYRIYTAILTRS